MVAIMMSEIMTPYANTIPGSDHRPGEGLAIFFSQSKSSDTRTASSALGKSDNGERKAEYTVLVVNDMPDQVEMMAHLLRQSGYGILTARDGHEGLEVAQAEHLDLIISDVSMPLMDGIEMCRLIREQPELSTIPILLVSAVRRDRESVARGLRAGADDYLEAPYDPMRLVARAAQLIERKRSNEALQESEAKYRELVENINDVIFAVDESGLISYVNPVIESVAGYSPSEVLGRSFTEFIFPEDLPGVLNNFRQVLAEKPQPSEYRIQTKSGKTVWVRTSSRPNMVGGHAAGLRGVMTDITDRKRAEEALRASEAELRALFGAMTDVILVLDAEGRYLKIAPTNPSYLYKPRADLVEKTLHQVFPKEEADFFLAHIRRALSEERMHRVEYKLQIDKTEVFFEGCVSPLSRDSVVWIGRDITEQKKAEAERKNLEQQFLQSQKVEAVGQLAGGIAHDFNNLLTAITGYSQLSMARLTSNDPLRSNLEEIKKAGDRAVSLTRQLLAFSRKQMLQPKVLDLNLLVSDLERMLRRLIGENIELRSILDPALGNVKADPGQIEQIVMNLVVNARDAMPHGGKLTIETANIFLDDEYAKHHIAVRSGDYVMLAISDNGCGMNEETRARIFEPFFTTKEVGKGTGLGLSTVYGIVKQSGGNIWAYSEVGKGTIFRVYLPRVSGDAEEYKRRTEPERAPQGCETILLVEDDQTVRRLTCEILVRYGYKVLNAAHGDEALIVCKRFANTIDLLLTDVVMPRMSGREVANQIAALRPEMKVLFMSGYTDEAIVHHGVLDANTPFIQKPFAPDALAQKVRDVLDGQGQP